MKFKINRKIALAVYITLIIFLVLQNPYFEGLNIVVSKTQNTETVLSIINGVVLQGSSLISYSTTQYQINITQIGYQLNVTSINFMSIFILISPFIIYVYFGNKKQTKKINIKRVNKK